MKILALVMMALCTACSYVSYEALPDGRTTASGFEIGTMQALSGVKFDTRADGSRSLAIDNLSSDQVQGLQQINQGLSLIIEGAAKGAK